MRTNYEVSLISFIGISLTLYFDSLLNMIWKNPNLNFITRKLHDTQCVCNYGDPCTKATLFTAVICFIYHDFKLSGFSN